MAKERTAEKNKQDGGGKILRGVVVSAKMKNTVVVEVNRLVKHPKYLKYIRVTKRYKADDPGNAKKEGEAAEIVETRPVSGGKHFKVLSRA